MTRQKKIEQEKQIESLIYLFIQKQEIFDYWLDGFLFFDVARTLNCSVHKVKKVFWKNLLVDKNFRLWLRNFEY